MSDLFGNHIVGFPTRRLTKYYIVGVFSLFLILISEKGKDGKDKKGDKDKDKKGADSE